MAAPSRGGESGNLSSELRHARSILEARLPLRTLVLGDSVAAGVDASNYACAFPSLFADGVRSRHGVPVHLVNLSVAGFTSADGLELAEEAARVYQPDLAIVEFGLNDLRAKQRSKRSPFARGVQIPVETYRSNILRIADRFRRRSGADVILVAPFPFPGSEPYRQALADIASRTTFVLADVAERWPGDGDLLDAEGMHPNDAGHRIYADSLAALL
jgi:lysophospholipase L1-like esterase